MGYGIDHSDPLSDLNPRDDLESLAFVLLYLLRGNLPWHKLCDAGTALARIPQIRSKMLSWNGTRLAGGYPSVFGELLEYARQLSFDDPIDYERFRAAFDKLRHSEVERNVSPGKIFLSVGPEDVLIVNFTDPIPAISRECPAAPGDLVLVQINPQTSVEGYTLRDDNSAYWSDPSLSGESWKSPFRPAVILSSTEKEEGRYSFLVVPLTKLTPGGALSLKEIGVAGLPDSLSNLFAYVFPRATEIRCLPSQVHLSIFFNASQLI
jgi:casein kinase I family protein HRR25